MLGSFRIFQFGYRKGYRYTYYTADSKADAKIDFLGNVVMTSATVPRVAWRTQPSSNNSQSLYLKSEGKISYSNEKAISLTASFRVTFDSFKYSPEDLGLPDKATTPEILAQLAAAEKAGITNVFKQFFKWVLMYECSVIPKNHWKNPVP